MSTLPYRGADGQAQHGAQESEPKSANSGVQPVLIPGHPGLAFEALRSDPPPSARGLSEDDLDIVFQPIVSVADRQTLAYEALTRCRWPNLTNPEVLFRLASEESCCGRLGKLVRAVAVRRAPGVPLFVNVHPDELSARWARRSWRKASRPQASSAPSSTAEPIMPRGTCSDGRVTR
jgi:hypothetical protein